MGARRNADVGGDVAEPRRRRANITDVADKAGVSKGLVSFVLNDRPGVAAATRERILDAVRELDWRPSQAARSLTTDRAYAMGLVLARPADLLAVDPFFPAFIAGVEAELSERNSALVLQVVPDLDAELATYRRLLADNRVDGVLVADLRVDDPRPRSLAAMGLPAVTLGRPEGARRCPAVVLDDAPGVAAAVEHLADLGHERVAFVGGPGVFLHARHRHEAWRATLERCGLPHDARADLTGDFSGASGAAAMARLLELPARHRPTAVLFANDLMAVAGVAESQRRGYPVPDAISVVGFDDIAVAAHVHPSLTTIVQDAVAWGRAATRAVFELVEHGEASDVELPPARLLVRESTGPAPARVGAGRGIDRLGVRRGATGPAPIDVNHGNTNKEESMRQKTPAAMAVLGLTAAAWGATAIGGTAGASSAATARGDITIWLSNNAFEVEWGTAMVEAWNAEHPDEQITAQEIPAGRTSEEVIGAAITAGNAPCLVFNTAPAAVPQFERQGGLVSLDSFEDGAAYVAERSGDRADQYRSSDGGLYQMPWKANPVMIFYNRTIFEEAGLDPDNPPLATYDEFLATAQTLVDEGGVQAAIWPSPAGEFFQPWFDFYPLYIAQSGLPLVEDGQATFASEDGFAVAAFWRSLYDAGLSPREAYNGDAFGDGESAMAIVGPWAIAYYGDDVDWSVVPVPTAEGTPAEEIHTFSDEKSIGMFTACENQGTAWDVLKFATSEEQDGALLEISGQMPMRTDVLGTFPDYFEANPDYVPFAEQADRTVEVPNVPNSIEVWQAFRDAWSESVIFGDSDPEEALTAAADTINDLVAG